MSYPDETMRLARGLAEDIEMLGEAEALGVLGASGDQDASDALEETLSKLAALRDRARRERDRGRSDG